MRKTIFFVILLNIIVTFSGCYNDDDFAPYENYTKTVNSAIDVEVKKLTDIIPEINKIAQKQQSNLVLTDIKMIFEGEHECSTVTGTIIFEYAKPHDKINQISKMDVHYNMSTKTIEKFDWEKGHGKRVNCITDEISDKYLNLSFLDILHCFNSDSNFKSALIGITPKIEIELNFDRMSVFLFNMVDMNSSPVFRYSS